MIDSELDVNDYLSITSRSCDAITCHLPARFTNTSVQTRKGVPSITIERTGNAPAISCDPPRNHGKVGAILPSACPPAPRLLFFESPNMFRRVE